MVWSLVILISVILASSYKIYIWFLFYSFQPLVKFLILSFIPVIMLTILILKSVYDNSIADLIIILFLLSVVLHNLFQVVWTHCVFCFFVILIVLKHFDFEIIVNIQENYKCSTERSYKYPI